MTDDPLSNLRSLLDEDAQRRADDDAKRAARMAHAQAERDQTIANKHRFAHEILPALGKAVEIVNLELGNRSRPTVSYNRGNGPENPTGILSIAVNSSGAHQFTWTVTYADEAILGEANTKGSRLDLSTERPLPARLEGFDALDYVTKFIAASIELEKTYPVT